MEIAAGSILLALRGATGIVHYHNITEWNNIIQDYKTQKNTVYYEWKVDLCCDILLAIRDQSSYENAQENNKFEGGKIKASWAAGLCN